MRPGADERHFSQQDIYQLRQFVDICPAENISERGHPGIVLYRLSEVMAVLDLRMVRNLKTLMTSLLKP